MANKKPPAPTGGSEALKVSPQSPTPGPQGKPTVIRTERYGRHEYQLLSATPPVRVKPGRTVRPPGTTRVQLEIPCLSEQLQGGGDGQRV
jgi:hypothetical protein